MSGLNPKTYSPSDILGKVLCLGLRISSSYEEDRDLSLIHLEILKVITREEPFRELEDNLRLTTNKLCNIIYGTCPLEKEKIKSNFKNLKETIKEGKPKRKGNKNLFLALGIITSIAWHTEVILPSSKERDLDRSKMLLQDLLDLSSFEEAKQEIKKHSKDTSICLLCDDSEFWIQWENKSDPFFDSESDITENPTPSKKLLKNNDSFFKTTEKKQEGIHKLKKIKEKISNYEDVKKRVIRKTASEKFVKEMALATSTLLGKVTGEEDAMTIEMADTNLRLLTQTAKQEELDIPLNVLKDLEISLQRLKTLISEKNKDSYRLTEIMLEISHIILILSKLQKEDLVHIDELIRNSKEIQNSVSKESEKVRHLEERIAALEKRNTFNEDEVEILSTIINWFRQEPLEALRSLREITHYRNEKRRAIVGNLKKEWQLVKKKQNNDEDGWRTVIRAEIERTLVAKDFLTCYKQVKHKDLDDLMDQTQDLLEKLEDEFEEVQAQKIENFQLSIQNHVENQVDKSLQKVLGKGYQEDKFSPHPSLIGSIRSKLSHPKSKEKKISSPQLSEEEAPKFKQRSKKTRDKGTTYPKLESDNQEIKPFHGLGNIPGSYI